MALVVKKFELDESKDTFLFIQAREKGLWALILTWLGIAPVTELKCNRKEVLFKTSNLWRQGSLTIPISAVTGVRTGFRKPTILLILAGVFFVLSGVFFIIREGAMGGVGGWISASGIIVAIVLVISYFGLRAMMFGFYNGGDSLCGVIHVVGSGVNFSSFEQAAELINKVVNESKNLNVVYES